TPERCPARRAIAGNRPRAPGAIGESVAPYGTATTPSQGRRSAPPPSVNATSPAPGARNPRVRTRTAVAGRPTGSVPDSRPGHGRCGRSVPTPDPAGPPPAGRSPQATPAPRPGRGTPTRGVRG